jgi:hypothetical protein
MNKILELIKKDQRNILKFKDKKISLDELKILNSEISKVFLELIKIRGFPYKNTTEPDTYKAAITLSLHLHKNDLEILFENIKNSTKKMIDSSDMAYLQDRVLVNKGKKQLYGTNFEWNAGGEIIFKPIEDIKNVNKRRAEVGLCTLDEYKEFIKGKRDSVFKT